MSAAEPSNADILSALKELATETKTRHEALAHESRQRDTAQTESRARLEAKTDESFRTLTLGFTTLHQDVAVLKSIVPKAETLAREAHLIASSTQKAHDDILVANQDQWRSIAQGQDNLARMLEAQNEEKRRSDAEKAASRERESLAAKRVVEEKERQAKAAAEAKERAAKLAAEQAAEDAKAALVAAAEKAHREADERIANAKIEADKQKVRWGTIQAIVLALIASAGGCGVFTAHQSAADASAKIDAQTRQIAELSKRFQATPTISFPGGAVADTVTTVVASPPAPASLPPSMPASAAPRAAK